MASAPRPPLTIAVHRGGKTIVASEVASLAVGIDVADTLVTQGGICTIRDRRGVLYYAVNQQGQRVTPTEGRPSDLAFWRETK